VDAAGTAGLTIAPRDPDPPAARLRQAGLRATAPRVAVLRELTEVPGHHSADELAQRLRARGIPIARASVYNVLDDLVRCELVTLADAGPGRALYEAHEAGHHHFVCRRCGHVEDVPCLSGARPCLQADLRGAIIDDAQVILRGICARCVTAR
jgi:Fur family transcriptional regulator, stress-responsive regulator